MAQTEAVDGGVDQVVDDLDQTLEADSLNFGLFVIKILNQALAITAGDVWLVRDV